MTELTRLVFDVVLTLRSPFLFRTIAATAYGYDEAQLKDAKGRPLIPADQFKGVFKDMLANMLAAYPDHPGLKALLDLFGTASSGEGDGASDSTCEGSVPNRGRISFSDLAGIDEHIIRAGGSNRPEVPPAFRVKINEATGAAQTGALQVIEQVVPPNELVRFKGSIILFGDERDIQALETAFPAAMKMASSIGAMKSAGFGEIISENCSLELRKADTRAMALPTVAAMRPDQDYLEYLVTFDRPILVDADRIAANAFIGASIIPGAVFKAGLASALERCNPGSDFSKGQIDRVLASIRFSHAYPLPQGGETGSRPMQYLPSSLISVGSKDDLKIRDALHLSSSPEGWQSPMINGEAPFFPLDWKGDAFARALQETGIQLAADVPAIPRTRTQVSGDQASKGQLFTSIARAHEWQDGEPVKWNLSVDFSCLGTPEDREIALRLLTLMELGLDGLGKTDASATLVRCSSTNPHMPRPIDGQAGHYALVLRSSALILDLNGLQDGGGNWTKTPHEAYADYFSKVLPGARLESAFATQKLTGGYLAHRRRLYGSSGYYPFLLTEPGSVFRLSNVKEADLTVLARRGLPLPEFEGIEARAISWRNCPFVPENGFGDFNADYLSDPLLAAKLRKDVDHV